MATAVAIASLGLVLPAEAAAKLTQREAKRAISAELARRVSHDIELVGTRFGECRRRSSRTIECHVEGRFRDNLDGSTAFCRTVYEATERLNKVAVRFISSQPCSPQPQL